MTPEIINPKDYNLEEASANELTSDLGITLQERDLLEIEFKQISGLEVNLKNIPKFRDLRLKIQKNRTQGIGNWHTNAKNYFLRGGQFVDAIKRREIAINQKMEEVLLNAEKHIENQEKERLAALQSEREEALAPYIVDFSKIRDLSTMDEDVWKPFLASKKLEFEKRIAEEKRVEAERIAKEKADAAERVRLIAANKKLEAAAKVREEADRKAAADRAKEDADRKAKEDAIQKAHENQLRLEREAREAVQEEERLKRVKLEEELEAIKKIERDQEIARQQELTKGDAPKMEDLVNDLINLKTKYTFTSEASNKTYSDVCILLDKIVNFIR